MNRIITFFLLSCFFFTHQNSQACSCTGPLSICEMITAVQASGSDQRIVVRGKKTSNTSTGMRFKIAALLWGNESKNSIDIRSGDGANCIMPTDHFETGDEFLFVLERFDDEYTISICGTNLAEIDNNNIIGFLTPGHEWNTQTMPYEEFLELEDCGFISMRNAINEARLINNPTKDKVKIIVESSVLLQTQIRLIDTSGRIISKTSLAYDLSTTVNEVSLESLAGGIYFVELSIGNTRKVFKVLKV